MRFVLEGCLELIISAFIDLNTNDLETAGLHEKVSYAFAIITIVIIVGFAIFAAVFLNCKSQEQLLTDRKLKSVYDAIISGIQLRRKQGIYFTSIFLTRRLAYGMILVFLAFVPVF